MQFRLKPTVRHLSLAFPVLLTAVPLTMNAAEDRPGAALPPPSLYDVMPSRPPSTPSATSTATKPSAVAPAMDPAPSATAPAAKPSPAAAPVATKPAPQPAMQQAAAPSEPWYKRWFGWLFAPKAASKPAEQTTMVAQASDSGARGQYAYYESGHAIRSGFTGECVRTGFWSNGTATADCDADAYARAHEKVKVAMAPPTSAPKAAAPVIATSKPSGGSAPMPAPVAVRKAEPVEVVPLPPAPPAAKEERPLAPEVSKDEPITALAMASEPEFDKLTLSAGALFPLSSTEIKPLGREKLDDLVSKLKGTEYGTVRVVGYTDPTGPAQMNARLSKGRADSVKRYLISKGIDGSRIETEGKGGSDPLPKPENCDALPRMEKIICYAPDRRVEIEVVGKPHG